MKSWTKTDVDLLLELCTSQTPWQEIANRLCRTMTSCRNKYDRYTGPKHRPRVERKVKDLTPEQVIEAKRLRASAPSGRLNLRVIAKALGVSERAVERVIPPQRMPGRKQVKRDGDALVVRASNLSVPESVLNERNRAYESPVTITAELFGDPKPGRSALDRILHASQG